MSSALWIIRRRAPTAPEGAVYFTGTYDIVTYRPIDRVGDPGVRVLTPDIAMDRRHAAIFEETAARLIAELLTDFGPAGGTEQAEAWRAEPAAGGA